MRFSGLVLSITAVIFLSGYTFVGDIQSRTYEVKFGIMKEDNEGYYYVSTETTIIPRLYKETGFRWGYTVKEKRGMSFSIRKTLYLPDAPKQITGNLNNVKISEGGRKIVDKEFKVKKGIYSDTLWFDEGDPLGTYRIELYINDKLERVIDFEVRDQ